MNKQKILDVLEVYENHLVRIGADNKEAFPDIYPSKKQSINHLLTMISKIREFVEQGRKEKAFRWLGFMQGVLWTNGNFTLKELKDHNRPTVNLHAK